MTELTPVERAIRDAVAAAYPAWSRRCEPPAPTRAGLRYLAHDTAALLAPALKGVGLLVFDDGFARTFVSPTGRQFTRARLGELIAGALTDHPDEILRASVGSQKFWERLAERVPEYAGETIERPRPAPRQPDEAPKPSTEYAREYRARRAAQEAASARAFLTRARPLLEGRKVTAADLYAYAVKNIARRLGEPITDDEDSDFWAIPGPRRFYLIADEILGGRLRRSSGYVYNVARRLLWRKRPLHPTTEEALRSIARRVRGAATEEPAPERRRLAWRDRPLSATADAALRGVAAAVLADEEGSA